MPAELRDVPVPGWDWTGGAVTGGVVTGGVVTGGVVTGGTVVAGGGVVAGGFVVAGGGVTGAAGPARRGPGGDGVVAAGGGSEGRSLGGGVLAVATLLVEEVLAGALDLGARLPGSGQLADEGVTLGGGRGLRADRVVLGLLRGGEGVGGGGLGVGRLGRGGDGPLGEQPRHQLGRPVLLDDLVGLAADALEPCAPVGDVLEPVGGQDGLQHVGRAAGAGDLAGDGDELAARGLGLGAALDAAEASREACCAASASTSACV